MALVITLAVGDAFSVGPFRYRVSRVSPKEGIILVDDAGRQFDIDQGAAKEVTVGVTFREGPRVLSNKARLAIVAPPETKIARGSTNA